MDCWREIMAERLLASICKYADPDGDDYEQVSTNLMWLVKSAVKDVAVKRARIALLSVPSSNVSSVPVLTVAKTQTAIFLVPFGQDNQFIGRENIISEIDERLETEQRIALIGIGGIGHTLLNLLQERMFINVHAGNPR